MSERESIPAHVHPEATLLPWYANGTLAEVEQQQVARHMESCADCRHELDDLTQIRNQLTILYRSQPEPSAHLAGSIFARIAREASALHTAPETSESWLDRLDRRLRMLFTPQWVPTLAATLLMAQLGLLLWSTMPRTPSEEITTRSLGSPTITFTVTFQERATEEQIRALLTAVRGRIINGPSPERTYVIEVIAGDPVLTMKTLESLRARTEVVRTAEVTAP